MLRHFTQQTTLNSENINIIEAYSPDMTFTLRAATGSAKCIHTKCIGKYAIKIEPTGSDTIEGKPSYSLDPFEGICFIDESKGQWSIL